MTSSRKSLFDFARVSPTPEELQAYVDTHHGHRPGKVYRVRCRACHKRIWASGLGIGAHRQACEVLSRLTYGDITALQRKEITWDEVAAQKKES